MSCPAVLHAPQASDEEKALADLLARLRCEHSHGMRPPRQRPCRRHLISAQWDAYVLWAHRDEVMSALEDGSKWNDLPCGICGGYTDLPHQHSFSTVEVPVVDGVATLPDGRTVHSSANVVRVPVLDRTQP